MFLFAKKRYTGWLFENDSAKKKLYMTGIVLKRKDNADIVKFVYKQILKDIIDTDNVYERNDDPRIYAFAQTHY